MSNYNFKVIDYFISNQSFVFKVLDSIDFGAYKFVYIPISKFPSLLMLDYLVGRRLDVQGNVYEYLENAIGKELKADTEGFIILNRDNAYEGKKEHVKSLNRVDIAGRLSAGLGIKRLETYSAIEIETLDFSVKDSRGAWINDVNIYGNIIDRESVYGTSLFYADNQDDIFQINDLYLGSHNNENFANVGEITTIEKELYKYNTSNFYLAIRGLDWESIFDYSFNGLNEIRGFDISFINGGDIERVDSFTVLYSIEVSNSDRYITNEFINLATRPIDTGGYLLNDYHLSDRPDHLMGDINTIFMAELSNMAEVFNISVFTVEDRHGNYNSSELISELVDERESLHLAPKFYFHKENLLESDYLDGIEAVKMECGVSKEYTLLGEDVETKEVILDYLFNSINDSKVVHLVDYITSDTVQERLTFVCEISSLLKGDTVGSSLLMFDIESEKYKISQLHDIENYAKEDTIGSSLLMLDIESGKYKIFQLHGNEKYSREDVSSAESTIVLTGYGENKKSDVFDILKDFDDIVGKEADIYYPYKAHKVNDSSILNVILLEKYYGNKNDIIETISFTKGNDSFFKYLKPSMGGKYEKEMLFNGDLLTDKYNNALTSNILLFNTDISKLGLLQYLFSDAVKMSKASSYDSAFYESTFIERLSSTELCLHNFSGIDRSFLLNDAFIRGVAEQINEGIKLEYFIKGKVQKDAKLQYDLVSRKLRKKLRKDYNNKFLRDMIKDLILKEVQNLEIVRWKQLFKHEESDFYRDNRTKKLQKNLGDNSERVNRYRELKYLVDLFNSIRIKDRGLLDISILPQYLRDIFKGKLSTKDIEMLDREKLENLFISEGSSFIKEMEAVINRSITVISEMDAVNVSNKDIPFKVGKGLIHKYDDIITEGMDVEDWDNGFGVPEDYDPKDPFNPYYPWADYYDEHTIIQDTVWSGAEWELDGGNGIVNADKEGIAIINDLNSDYFKFSVDVLAGGSPECKAGVVFKYRDPLNYYKILLNPGHVNTISLYRVVNGVEKKILSPITPISIEIGKYYTVSITVLGDKITIKVNNRLMYDFIDEHFSSM